MKAYRTDPSRWQRFVSGITMFAVACLTALSFSGCSDSSDSSSLTPVTVAAPGAPTAFTVTGGANVATLQWSPPAASATAGLPDSYEIYGSTTATTAATIVAPANLVKTIPVVSGQAVYSHTALGLAGGNTYSFVVTAKNTGGETPSTVASAQVTVPVVAPGAPTAFTVIGGENVATLQWSPPAASATAGLPVTYEIYGSTTATTAATLVAPANFVASVSVISGQTVYSYTALGLVGGNATHYFVVTAKNTGGETPSSVASGKVTGPPKPQTYGNNFSAALVFADDIGITNLTLDPLKSWTISDVTLIDYNTGLRPLPAEVTAMLALTVPQTTLPYLTVTSKIDPLYYEQKSINTWQGEWAKGKATPQDVNAKWGDNLAGTASLSASAKIRIEMVLTKDVTATPMTAYPMKLLSGSGTSELQGTTGVATPVTTAFVFATNARLTLQKLDAAGVPGPMVIDQALFDPNVKDGLNKLSAEIPVSGNFTYGFVWDPATGGSTAGKYRVTFKLDPTSAFGTGKPANNTFMKTATNGVRVSDTEVYIDIDVK
jgi:hypothetical protein